MSSVDGAGLGFLLGIVWLWLIWSRRKEKEEEEARNTCPKVAANSTATGNRRFETAKE
jgi:hypothetical protein